MEGAQNWKAASAATNNAPLTMGEWHECNDTDTDQTQRLTIAHEYVRESGRIHPYIKTTDGVREYADSTQQIFVMDSARLVAMKDLDDETREIILNERLSMVMIGTENPTKMTKWMCGPVK